MSNKSVMSVELVKNLAKPRQIIWYEKIGFVVIDVLVSECIHDSGNFVCILEAYSFEYTAYSTDTEERRHALQHLAEEGQVVCTDLVLFLSLASALGVLVGDRETHPFVVSPMKPHHVCHSGCAHPSYP